MYADVIDRSQPAAASRRAFATLYANQANRIKIDRLKDALEEMPHCYFKMVKNLDADAGSYLVWIKGLFMAAVGNPELLDPPEPFPTTELGRAILVAWTCHPARDIQKRINVEDAAATYTALSGLTGDPKYAKFLEDLALDLEEASDAEIDSLDNEVAPYLHAIKEWYQVFAYENLPPEENSPPKTGGDGNNSASDSRDVAKLQGWLEGMLPQLEPFLAHSDEDIDGLLRVLREICSDEPARLLYLNIGRELLPYEPDQMDLLKHAKHMIAIRLYSRSDVADGTETRGKSEHPADGADDAEEGPVMTCAPKGREHEFGAASQLRFRQHFEGQMHPDQFQLLMQMHKIQAEMDENRLGGDIPFSAVVAEISRRYRINEVDAKLMVFKWGKCQSECDEDYRENTWFSEKARRAYENNELEQPSQEELRQANSLHFAQPWSALETESTESGSAAQPRRPAGKTPYNAGDRGMSAFAAVARSGNPAVPRSDRGSGRGTAGRGGGRGAGGRGGRGGGRGVGTCQRPGDSAAARKNCDGDTGNPDDVQDLNQDFNHASMDDAAVAASNEAFAQQVLQDVRPRRKTAPGSQDGRRKNKFDVPYNPDANPPGPIEGMINRMLSLQPICIYQETGLPDGEDLVNLKRQTKFGLPFDLHAVSRCSLGTYTNNPTDLARLEF